MFGTFYAAGDPHMIAPGVSILRVWNGVISPTRMDIDPQQGVFNSTYHICTVPAGERHRGTSEDGATQLSSAAMINSVLMMKAHLKRGHSTGKTITGNMVAGKAACQSELGAGHVQIDRPKLHT